MALALLTGSTFIALIIMALSAWAYERLVNQAVVRPQPVVERTSAPARQRARRERF